ncbi:MAG: bifunctional diaminohydroxyphosphoribosylaminopyrimidine deaminase/5-amino-6-(5-phosphoribosylamino)uracil reductase RibD, partial [Bdellovibrionales bacterium]|nr:bifunctional diaminohydroxyphosphoribosylaminopyrimidine deaminase/5-amino-6-(5-phosphoribosylamino)uracil reductase RibD [Bdellovibrionales bacterium]
MGIDHQIYMEKAISLAINGRGLVSPNPLVGAVIVKDGKIIGEGFHERAGTDHAEVVAIKNAIEDVSGSTLYCNLEPCCHTDKRTPPCVDLLIEKKIKRVVLCNLDPNPKVCGKGIKLLRAAGIEVELGLLEKEGKKLNETFFKFITSGLPFVHLKMAMSLDGKIALANGKSKWITCEDSRKIVHQMRFDYDAVMIGRETLNKDNPKLTIRDVESFGKCPYRIVMGNPSAMNLDSDLFIDEYKKKTIVLTEVGKWNNASETIKDFFYRND